ncbi:glycosyltransferase 87 family protein [Streptomyces sp. NPDC015131]|uniref:glycosyltransferase 87 family protein n=1 Tax=Streptomyces sp. NPDC015131 TaxID=3364941 RepID=UPI0036FAE330
MIRTRAARAVWGGCAAVAAVLAAVSDLAPHRVWGTAAACGYTAAALLAPRRRAACAAALLGAVAVPLLLLVATGRGQLETAVVERSGALLRATGVPYAAEPAGLADYNPYLPGMAVIGALPGDPRWWTGAVLVGALAAAKTVPPRLLAPVAACPLVALPLAVGGVDLPVAGLMCLGLALAGRGRAGGAGLALGAAAALKWTAWPALPVAVALLAATRGAPHTGGGGRRGAAGAPWRCAGVAAAVAGGAVLPAAVAAPSAFREHVLAFPLGLTGTTSPAASPFPGRLLAAHVPGGTVAAAGLLAVSAVLLAASLVLRPPRTVPEAARRLALGLTLAVALMPASRFGYLVHPFVLLVCLRGLPCTARSWSPTTSRPAREASRRS